MNASVLFDIIGAAMGIPRLDFETLEYRRMLSAAAPTSTADSLGPSISALVSSVDHAVYKQRITLTATNVTDPTSTIKFVEFYDDSDDDGQLTTTGPNPDLAIGRAAASTGFSAHIRMDLDATPRDISPLPLIT